MGNIGNGRVKVKVGQAMSLATIMLAAGCATVSPYPPPSSTQLAAAESSVKSARDNGASADPKAARHLRAAEESLSTAKDRAAAGDNTAATLLLARADAEADLGLVTARASKAKGEASTVEMQLAQTRAAQPGNTGPGSTPSSTPSTPSAPSNPTPAAPATP